MAQFQILFYMHYQPTMVTEHGTKYEENPSSYHKGMHEDEETDVPEPFLYSPIPLALTKAYFPHDFRLMDIWKTKEDLILQKRLTVLFFDMEWI